MKTIKHIIILIVVSLVGFFTNRFAYSQQVNTLYFLENVPVRHYFNPAFQPVSKFYLGLPVAGFTQLGVGNNSFTLSSLNSNKSKVFSGVRPITLLSNQEQINLLDFGFRANKAYITVGVTTKVNVAAGVPKELIKLLMYGNAKIVNGQPEYTNTVFDLKSLTVGADAYTEFALGYSRIINDQWTAGAKLKYLYGHGSVRARFTNFDLVTGIDEWTLNADGVINASLPGITTVGNNLKSVKHEFPDKVSQIIKPEGAGGAIDLGLTFKPLESLTLSAALIDLGFIRWNQNANNVKVKAGYVFDGIGTVNTDDLFDGIDSKALVDTLLNKMENSVATTNSTKSFSTGISPKMNVSAEYSILKNTISFGLLSTSSFYNKSYYQDVTTSVTFKPLNWINLGLSYSLFNGEWSNLGAGLGLRLGFLNAFFTTDYAPLNYSPFPLSALGLDPLKIGNRTISKPYLPYKTDRFNFAFGFNFVFGNKQDKDKDGVSDRKDKCPMTPKGVAVDKYGCPVDTDHDGVSDYLDKCPDTPADAFGFIDAKGCPLDTDGDGVPDYLDKCPGTSREASGKVDEAGCLLDTDHDGVPDYLDKCPDTPAEGIGFVDGAGCLLDTDNDGVPDYRDKCPNTVAAAIAFVDSVGCDHDSDRDGIPDYLDKCPDTPVEAFGKVDSLGCPLDTDGDGVYDYLDRCPRAAGAVSNSGCPEVKPEVRMLFQKALQGIQFQSGKSLIKPSSYALLNQVAQSLIENSGYLVEVQGHTDNVGSKDGNLKLSADRATSVRKYLIGKGVDERRIRSKGYGDAMPIVPNTTSKNKATNRRVEFVVTFGGVGTD